MSYKIVVTDDKGTAVTCYDPANQADGDHTLSVINPHLELDIENGGTFEFTLPPENILHTEIELMKYTVDVYEDDNIIWTGRPTSMSEDFYNREKYRCEGALNYLHDSIQPKVEYNKTNIVSFIQALLNLHNDNCPDNRKIYMGNTYFDTSKSKYVYTGMNLWRQTDFEDTFECFEKMVLNALGGYIQIRKYNRRLYLDYWENMEALQTGTQTVNFGSNLLDFVREWDATSVITDIIPVCHYTLNGIDRVYDVSSINDGKEYVRDDAAYEQYGRIAKVLECDMVKDLVDTTDISDPEEKRTAKEENQTTINITKEDMLARAYVELYKNKQADLVINISAADLSKFIGNSSVEAFKLGTKVRIISEPHGIDEALPVSKITMDLTSGKKDITIGTPKKRNLTEIYKPKKKR